MHLGQSSGQDGTYTESGQSADDAGATVLYEGAGYDLEGASDRPVRPLLYPSDTLCFLVEGLKHIE